MMQFPIDMPIKVIGISSVSFEQEIIAIAQQHDPTLSEAAIKRKESKDGHYVSLTLTVTATTQEKLDALYRALTQHPNIKMVL